MKHKSRQEKNANTEIINLTASLRLKKALKRKADKLGVTLSELCRELLEESENVCPTCKRSL